MAAFIVASELRAYLGQSSTSGRYSDANLASNIRAASGYLQTKTGRQFAQQDATAKTFTTHDRAILVIPDLRSATTVTLNGSALVANEGYHLLPDRKSSGIYTGIQFRVPYRGDMWGDRPWYLSDASWFDRGLDLPGGSSSEPNDLVITGGWGYLTDGSEPSLPQELLHVTKVLAGFYTLRPDSVLAGVSVTPEGAVFTYRELPMEVRAFIEEWTLGEQAIAV